MANIPFLFLFFVITFDIKLFNLGNEKKECKCGAANCSGYLGLRPKSQLTVSEAEKQKIKKKKEKEARMKKILKNKLEKVGECRLISPSRLFFCESFV